MAMLAGTEIYWEVAGTKSLTSWLKNSRVPHPRLRLPLCLLRLCGGAFPAVHHATDPLPHAIPRHPCGTTNRWHAVTLFPGCRILSPAFGESVGAKSLTVHFGFVLSRRTQFVLAVGREPAEGVPGIPSPSGAGGTILAQPGSSASHAVGPLFSGWKRRALACGTGCQNFRL